MNIGIISISPDSLYHMLNIHDKGFKHKRSQYDFIKDSFDLIVEHKEIKEVEEDNQLPPVMIVYRKNENNTVSINSIDFGNKKIQYEAEFKCLICNNIKKESEFIKKEIEYKTNVGDNNVNVCKKCDERFDISIKEK